MEIMTTVQHERSKQAVRSQARNIFRSMSQLAKRVRRVEGQLNQLERPVNFQLLTDEQEEVERERNNQRSYLRAELEMSREMHARLEGVFDRLLALLDAKEADTYSRMHLASSKL